MSYWRSELMRVLNWIKRFEFGDDLVTLGPGGLSTTGPVTVSGAFTSLGIDDNATGERVQIADALLTLGTAGAGYVIAHPDTDRSLIVNGGNANQSGGSIRVFGPTHASTASDIILQSDADIVQQWDESALEMQFPRGLVSVGAGGLSTTGSGVFSGNLTTGTNLIASGVNLVMGPTGGTGGIFFRPEGVGSGTNQVFVDTNGLLTIASGQIAFPATQNPSANANTLDDYEEGTFTPTAIGTTSAGAGTYDSQVGVYTKIGNAVLFNAAVQWSAHTGTGNLRLGGLPFTAAAGSNIAASIFSNSLTYPEELRARVLASSTQVEILSNATGANAAAVAMDTSAGVNVSGLYFV